jgi:pyruvate/2-oxoglutarate dehydrogenase complex dihydrolipoamide acyltransferase (E2) component
MQGVLAIVLARALAPAARHAQQQAPPPSPAPQQPPAAPQPQSPTTPTTPATAAPAAASSARTFTAPAGIILNAVRPERVADFERLIGYLQSALTTSSDATVRAQAEGWKVLKASETGPNGAALYVFLFDPTVPGADYGLGRILASAYPDQTKLQEIWKLYTDSLASGGSLLNLTPLKVTPEESKDSPPAEPKPEK